MIRDPLPQKVIALENYFISKVVCGTDQTYSISEEEKLCFSWGCNQHAKLGHSYKRQSPEKIGQSTIQIVKQPTSISGLEGAEIT
jgi:alpha-tubulin suppressor-like RCC1 family protein